MHEPESLSYRAPLSDYEAEAAALWDALRAGDDAARWRVKWEHPRFRNRHVSAVDAATLDPGDARLVVARQYAFDAWPDLVAFTEAVACDREVARFEAAADAVVAGEEAALRAMLREHPHLARARSSRRHHATLLHYVAANGVERQRRQTPASAVAIATMLLEAGAEADALADMYDARCQRGQRRRRMRLTSPAVSSTSTGPLRAPRARPLEGHCPPPAAAGAARSASSSLNKPTFRSNARLASSTSRAASPSSSGIASRLSRYRALNAGMSGMSGNA
jgi:hypothetical protein